MRERTLIELSIDVEHSKIPGETWGTRGILDCIVVY